MTVRSRLAFIINPVAGSSGRWSRPADLLDVIRRRCAAADHEVAFTERPGHGRELAAALAGRGFSPVVAWGGDGTVNEVASGLIHRDTVMGIVPAGSGNGLARELGISLRPEEAIDTAVRGRDRAIDVGELAGRPFVNLAGVGLPASVADLFARLARQSSPDGSDGRPTNPAGVRAALRRRLPAGRGLGGYVLATARQLVRYRSQRYTVVTEGRSVERPALLIEVANGRQYGNGAVIAPHARLDDGLLDLVSVEPIGRARAAWGLWRLFNGTIDRHPYVHCSRVGGVTIAADRPLCFHVDGEVAQGGCSLTAKVHPRALGVRVPAPAGG